MLLFDCVNTEYKTVLYILISLHNKAIIVNTLAEMGARPPMDFQKVCDSRILSGEQVSLFLQT